MDFAGTAGDERTDDLWIRQACGQLLRHAREARGWTQGTLAQHLGLDDSTVSAWERGIQAMRTPMLVLVARTLEVPAWSLLPCGSRTPLGDLMEVLLSLPPTLHADILQAVQQILRIVQQHQAPQADP